jgi:hypothetical protein
LNNKALTSQAEGLCQAEEEEEEEVVVVVVVVDSGKSFSPVRVRF